MRSCGIFSWAWGRLGRLTFGQISRSSMIVQFLHLVQELMEKMRSEWFHAVGERKWVYFLVIWSNMKCFINVVVKIFTTKANWRNSKERKVCWFCIKKKWVEIEWKIKFFRFRFSSKSVFVYSLSVLNRHSVYNTDIKLVPYVCNYLLYATALAK